MKLTTIAASAATCLALGIVSAAALDIDLGGSLDAGLSDSGVSVSAEGNADVSDDTLGSVTRSAADTISGATSRVLDVLPEPGAIAEADAAAEGDSEIAQVVRLIETSHWSEASFSGGAQFSATLYDVSSWLTSETEATLAAAIEQSKGEISDLQSALAANANFNAWLQENSTDPEQVIAVGLTTSGSLAVFRE